MSKIDSWVTKVPRLKNSKVARFSYKAEAYANDTIEGVDSYDYDRDMNVPLATHTDFDASVLSIGARANFSSVPKNGLNHFFGRVSYNLNKVIDFLSDLLDDFRVQGVETVASSVSRTLPAYYSGKKLRIVNTHATSSILITFYSGQTFKGSSTVIIPANTILELELIGTTWLHVSDFTESPPTPWAQYSGKDIPQLPDNLAGTTYKRDNDWVDTDGWTPGHPSSTTLSVEDETLKVVYDGTRPNTGVNITKSINASGKFIKGHIKCTVPINDVQYYSGTAYVPLTLATPNAYETDFYGYMQTTSTSIILVINFDQITAKTCWLSQLYIGTGAYDRLVFDNSYHYRHLINNAVVPTPQGLYFNGATSYLRSKEPVTLPDVFTFSATVNCALKSTVQAFLAQNTVQQPTNRLLIHRQQNSNDLNVIGTDGTTASVFFNSVGYFTGLDNTDIDLKVEIDFVSKTIKSYRNGVQFGSTVSAPTIIKPSSNYIYIGNLSSLIGLLGYMRNICIYDTPLTDTQRNWLAQGNTPPILYDVTNYETEGYASIQDADGTNTGVETDVDSNGNRILKLPATIKANVTGNADTATLATQANAIKPLGNSITLPANPTSVTKIIKIATIDWTYNGPINIIFSSSYIYDGVKVHIGGGNSSQAGIRVIYGKNNFNYGIKKIIVTCNTMTADSTRNIYAEIKTFPNNAATTSLNVVETNRGLFTPSMTEVSSVEGTVVDSLSLSYSRGDISSYQHEFTKNIIGNVTGNASTASKANVRVSLRHGNTWFDKTFAGLTGFGGQDVWTDGDNIYLSYETSQFMLNKTTYTWEVKTWTGLTNFDGRNIWTDGKNIYYSDGTTQYALNKSTSTWTVKPWLDPYGSILITLIGSNIWTDGDNIYYSSGATQYVLNKSTAIWVAKTWFNLTAFNGDNVWTDGENIYYSDGTTQYALNKSTSTWGAKVWAGLPSFFGQHIWADGENIYYSAGTQQFILNKTTYTWVVKTWAGLPNFYYYSLWTDGENIYSSDEASQYVLPAIRHNYVADAKYNSLFGTVTKCNCSTLSDRFVFSNE